MIRAIYFTKENEVKEHEAVSLSEMKRFLRTKARPGKYNLHHVERDINTTYEVRGEVCQK